MLDSLTVPRRAYDFEDYIDIFRRNFRWIIAPTFLGLVISTVTAYMMQDTYYSAALIRVTPQQISPEAFATLTSQDVADRISSMAQTILSRNTLAGIINNYGLYKKELQKEPLEDVIDLMKRSINISPVGGTSVGQRFLPSMQVGFAYSNPYTAQKVCQDLVTRFMDLSVTADTNGKLDVHDFITNEMAQAKRDLDGLEQKLADFRAKNAGRLPEEMQMNMQQMNALGGRVDSLNEQLNRNSEQRMMLQQELSIAKDRSAALHSPQAQAQNFKVAALDNQIEGLENSIAAMRERYTESYPDLQAAKDQLAFLKRQRETAAKEQPTRIDNSAEAAAVARERQDVQDTIDRLQTQLKANAMDAKLLNSDLASANAGLHAYESRMSGIPTGDKEYSDLLRDRDLAKQRYIDLEIKAEKSNVSIDISRRKQGESMELLDAASLPMSPVAPRRQRIVPVGAVIGLVVGFVLVAIREVKDTSLKNLKDARLYTQLSILGSIPLLENDIVVQRRKQVMWVGWATATLAGLAVMAGTVARYYMLKGH
jgi:polysaccharide biosynthesis transport protein